MLNQRYIRKSVIFVSMFALVIAWSVACEKKTSPEKTEMPVAPIAPSMEKGSIRGKVHFTGMPPLMPELRREADPFCAKTKMKDEQVIVNSNGTLKNVALTLQGAPASGMHGSDAVVKIDQVNCMYTPRVVSGAFGQSVKIFNSDPVLHNVHTYVDSKTLFNRVQPKGAAAIEKTFSKEDGPIVKFKCDVHPWMTGWLILNDNAMNAVTGDSGEFEIQEVPVGTYQLQAWHEKYGIKTMEVTVKTNQLSEVDFHYDGTEKANYDYKVIHIGELSSKHSH